MSGRPRPVYVGAASVGRGVFAARAFRAGEVIAEVAGEVFDDPGYSTQYCMELGGPHTLEPSAPFRFLNHGCEPNCELFQYDSGSGWGDCSKRLWVQAIRRIEARQELRIDYGWPAEDAIPCRCGSSLCRGWIVAEDERFEHGTIASVEGTPFDRGLRKRKRKAKIRTWPSKRRRKKKKKKKKRKK